MRTGKFQKVGTHGVKEINKVLVLIRLPFLERIRQKDE